MAELISIIDAGQNDHLDYWDREVWEAFVLEPWFRDHLSKKDFSRFCRRARELVWMVNWTDYRTIHNSVLKLYGMLADEFSLPAETRNVSFRMMMRRFMIGRIHTFEEKAREECYQGICIEPGKDDLHNCDIAEIFAMLPPQPETAEWLQEIGVCYEYDNLHMVTWFAGQLSLGEGFYSRSCPNHSAKKTYERLKNPWSLLWIAAALGEDPAVVKAVAREMEDYLSWTAKCGVIRRAVPWKRIYELALRMKEREESEEINWNVPVRKIPARGIPETTDTNRYGR